MDIEKLKELRAEFEQMRKHNDRHYMSTITEDDVIVLIDEAIARQSVKSEEVAEAIGDLLDMKEHWCADSTDNDAVSIDLAITALQAYQPWIPVSEKLPDDGYCLACCSTGNRATTCFVHGESREMDELGYTITHWKPLPEIPRGNNNEA